MEFPRLIFILLFYVVGYLKACVIPIQENDEVLTSNTHRAGGYKIFK